MLLRWRPMISSAHTANPATSRPGAPRTAAASGRTAAAAIDPSDAVRLRPAATPNATTPSAAAAGTSTTAMPVAVATPLPPWKRRVAGATWPTTAATPQAAPNPCPPTAQPTPAAAAPLTRSPTSVSTPARRPAVRKTLVAPGLPEPVCVGSTPRPRVTNRAVGNVPSRYAPATQAAEIAGEAAATSRADTTGRSYEAVCARAQALVLALASRECQPGAVDAHL